MSTPTNIYLVGPMGAGKTSVGNQLARAKKTTFYDSDQEVEKRSGVTVSWVFEVEGEAGFRQREEAVIAELSKMKGIVIATGGGSVVTANNRKQLKATGVVVYLQVSFDKQFERTSRRKGTRPLLNQPNPKEKLAKLNQEREPLYQEIADLTYSTDKLAPAALAKRILADIKKLK